MLKHLKPLVKDSAIYALGNISGKIVGFILLPLYIKELSTVEYGILGTLEASFQLIVALGGLNLYVAFTRWYSDKEIKGYQESTFFTLLSVIFGLSVLINIFCYPFAPNLSSLLFDSVDYTRLVRLMIFSAGLELIGTIPATLCRVQSKPFQYTRNIIIRLGIVLVFTFIFLAVLDRKLEGIYEAQIIGGIAYLLLFLPYVIKNIKIRFEKEILRKMVTFSLPLVFSSSFGILLNLADRFTLNFISGLASVGVYMFGFKLANTLKVFIVSSINLALPPVMFQMADKPDAKRFYSKLMTYLTFGLMIFVLGISLFGQEIVKVLSMDKPDYWGAYAVIPFISFGIVFGMLKDQVTYNLQIVKKSGIIASITILVSLLNVGLNILLIPFFGAIGAALSTLFVQIIYFFLTLHYAQRLYHVAYEFKKVYTAIAIGVLFCLIAYYFHNWHIIWRLIIKSVLLISYPFILYWLHFFDTVEIQAIQGFWKKWKDPKSWKNNLNRIRF